MISQGRLIATTASQVLLPDNTTRHGFLVKSIATNTDRIFLGFVDAQSATTGGMPLEPGESQFFGTEYPVISVVSPSSRTYSAFNTNGLQMHIAAGSGSYSVIATYALLGPII